MGGFALGGFTLNAVEMVGFMSAPVLLGAGRAYMEQELDYGAGFELRKKVGDPVKKGQTIAVLHANDAGRLGQGERLFSEAVSVGAKAARSKPVIIIVPGGSLGSCAPIISNSRFTAIRSSGKGGCAAK